MSIMDEIKFYIKDEDEAYKTYSRMANDADNAGMHKTAQILRGMAADELRHKEMLEGMYYKPEFGSVRGKTLTDEIKEAYEEAKRTGKVTVSPFREHRPFPRTYGDWVNLAVDIKDRYPDDPVMRASVNHSLSQILAEEEHAEGWSAGSTAKAKSWLMQKAGELGIS